MVEWFNNLSEGWQTAIFGAVVTIALAIIGWLSGLFKWLLGKKDGPAPQQKTIHQDGSGQTAGNIEGNNNIIAGGNIHTGVSQDTLTAALQALNKVLEMVDTDQSKKLVSELKDVSDEKLNTPVELLQDQNNNNGQKLNLEKELQLYGELWKALVDMRSSIIITPSLDRMPKEKSPYDVYKDRYDVAVDAFNKANALFENNRPFYHDNVSKITTDILSQCRGYIRYVGRMLNSKNFDDKLYDKADELLETIPKAIDEIEKAIKMRIGLLPESKNEIDVPIGLEIGYIVQIVKGAITFRSNTSNIKSFIGLKFSITEGYLKRNDFGKLEVYIKTCVPFEPLQCLNEKLGLDSMHLSSESEIISEDSDSPIVFTSSTSHILPQGEMVLDISTWQEVPLPMTINVHTQTKASGHLKGKVFQGEFEANLTYDEINWSVGLNGDFQVHLA